MISKQKISGIYMILNIVNGKFYIGSSVNVNSRISGHKHLLNKGNHHSKYLQRAWNKYKEESFIFELIEKCDPEECLKREQVWLDFHQCYDKTIGYNIVNIAGRTTGYKHDKECLLKMSMNKKIMNSKLTKEELKDIYGKGRKDKPISDEHHSKLKEGLIKSGWLSSNRKKEIVKKSNFEKISKPLLQYDKEGNFITEYHNARIALDAIGLGYLKRSAGISNSINNPKSNGSAYGYIWKYKNNINI
jgi:group I intron endonuclease